MNDEILKLANDGERDECVWTEHIKQPVNVFVLDTECGKIHYFDDNGPNANGFVWCPYCGGVIIEASNAVGVSMEMEMSTCQGCKWYKDKKGYVPQCTRYNSDRPTRCLDFRHKQGQRDALPTK